MTPVELKKGDEAQTIIPDFEIESIARYLLPHISIFCQPGRAGGI